MVSKQILFTTIYAGFRNVATKRRTCGSRTHRSSDRSRWFRTWRNVRSSHETPVYICPNFVPTFASSRKRPMAVEHTERVPGLPEQDLRYNCNIDIRCGREVAARASKCTARFCRTEAESKNRTTYDVNSRVRTTCSACDANALLQKTDVISGKDPRRILQETPCDLRIRRRREELHQQFMCHRDSMKSKPPKGSRNTHKHHCPRSLGCFRIRLIVELMKATRG